MKKYIKGALEIEAQQITDSDFDGPHPNPNHVPGVKYDPIRRLARVDTPGGQVVAGVGDWIIRGIKGELYPCKHDVFIETYLEGTQTPCNKVVESNKRKRSVKHNPYRVIEIIVDALIVLVTIAAIVKLVILIDTWWAVVGVFGVTLLILIFGPTFAEWWRDKRIAWDQNYYGIKRQ